MRALGPFGVRRCHGGVGGSPKLGMDLDASPIKPPNAPTDTLDMLLLDKLLIAFAAVLVVHLAVLVVVLSGMLSA